MEIINGSTCYRVLCQTITRESIELSACNPRDHRQTLNHGVQPRRSPHRHIQSKWCDFVRVSKFKIIFEKGYTLNWTTEVFKIIKVQKNMSCITSLIPTCISLKKCYTKEGMRFTWNDWDLTIHTILGYTRIICYKKNEFFYYKIY